MAILSKLTASVAAIALSGTLLTPIAAAEKPRDHRVDRGDRGNEDSSRRRHNGDTSGRRVERNNSRSQPQPRSNDGGDRQTRNRSEQQLAGARDGNRNANRDRNRDVNRDANTQRQYADRGRDHRQHTDRSRDQRQHSDRSRDRNYSSNHNYNRNYRHSNNRYTGHNSRYTGHNTRYYGHRNNRYHTVNRDVYRYSSPSHRAYTYHRQPRRVVHHWYHTPRWSYVNYNYYDRHRHYTPRYHIGGHYGYHNNTIIISDYGYYGLYDPPYGHHWVRDHDTGDAILASVATGAIIGLVIGVLSN